MQISKKGKELTPFPPDAYKTFYQVACLPANVEAFLTVNNDLRHFGEAKNATVQTITKEKLCEYMTTAQQIWIYVLKELGRVNSVDFRHKFTFESRVERERES